MPVEVPLLSGPRLTSIIVVRAETDAGAVGYGVAGTMLTASVLDCINREIAPFVVGKDALLTEHVAHTVPQRLSARDVTGVVSSAISGVDIALWDLWRPAVYPGRRVHGAARVAQRFVKTSRSR